MGPDPVVLAAPPLDQHLRLQQRVEDLAVQRLVPQLAVEALDWNAKREFSSEVAQGYQTRIIKYGERLFTFLDHDGVPWNNNNAENALKLVASRRRLFGTSVSESGLKDYLVFLSIYQTLRRKGISLLRFLLSGETDLEKFVASYRRR